MEEASPSVPKRARTKMMVVGVKRRILKKKSTPSPQVSETIPKVEDEEEGETIEFLSLNKRTLLSTTIEEF